jgi:PAS domain S-box-containing protein
VARVLVRASILLGVLKLTLGCFCELGNARMAAVMSERADPRLVRRCAGIATASSAFVVAAGLTALAGWTLHIATLFTWRSATAMVPNTAAASVLAGLSLWRLRTPDNPPFSSVRQLTARAASVSSGLIGTFSLAEFLFRLDFGIDRLLLVTAPTLATAAFPPRMSPVTAAIFIFLSLSLLTIDKRTRRLDWPAQFLALAAMMAAAFGSIGILIVPGASPISLSLPTALTGLSLPIGIVCARAKWAIGGLLTSDTRGARLLRKTVPTSLFVLSLVGLLLSKPLLTGSHISAAAATLLALFCSILLAGFIVWIASIVDHDEIERRKIEEAQLLSSEQLDRLLNRIEEPADDTQLQRRVTLALTFAILLTGLLGFLSWRAAQQATETVEWVAHTHEVMTGLESALRHSLDVETGGRGFAETGSVPFLEPYESGRLAVVQDLHTLRLLLLTPDQLQRLNVLEEQMNHQVEDVEAIVVTRQNTGTIPNVALFEYGKHDMDAVRITVGQMEVAERGLLALRTQRARAAQHFSNVVIALGSLLGLMFLTVAGMTVSREIGVSAKARAQVKALNADLEQRVEQRTAALQSEVAVRKRTEEMRERLAAIVEYSDDAIISKTLDGTISAWNRGAEKVFGYSAAEIVGKPMVVLLPAERIDEESDILARIKRGESIEHFETVRVRKDGTHIDVSVTISPIRDGNGAIVGASKVARNITERKRSEADLARRADELLRSQQALETKTFMLESVLESMVEGLVAADEHGKFILWNPAAEKIIGLGATNIPPTEWGAHYGVFLSDMVTPIPPGETPLERALRGEAVTTEIFLRHSGLNPGLWLEANGSPLIDKDGVRRGGVLAFRDISRRKTDELVIRNLNEELEEKIAKRTEQLEATNHELEAFSYSVSHDLRTPLRHVAGFVRILVNDFGPVMAVEAREHLQRIEDAVRRMGMLIDALLKMAVLRRRPLRLSHSELNPIVDEVISMLQPECEGRDVEWCVAQLPALDCDPVLIAQVFQNLLGNAMKYSRGRARAVIEVDSIQRPGKPAIIFVRDNGAGFNMRYAERLFGVFQRFHTDSEFEGTGVGLATVHRIIQKHGGTIWAEAEVDHGATFYFALEMSEQIGTMPKAAS